MNIEFLSGNAINLTVEEFIILCTKSDFLTHVINTEDLYDKALNSIKSYVEKHKDVAETIMKSCEEKTTPAVEVADEPDHNGMITSKELADIFGVTVSSIYHYRLAGMPFYKTKGDNGIVMLYDKDACVKWYESNRKRGLKTKKSSEGKMTIKDDYYLWKNEINRICREANKDPSKMLSLTFKYMNKNYGVVWEQEEKDYYKENKCKPYSTSRLAFWMEQKKPACKNLTISCLQTIIKEQCA